MAKKRSRKAQRREQRAVLAYKTSLTTQDAIAVLERVVSGLRSGAVSVEHGQEQLTIRPGDAVRVGIRARRTHKSEGIRVRLSWPRAAGTEAPPEFMPSTG